MASRWEFASRVFGVVAIAIGAIGLLGWILSVESLKSLTLPISMKANTSVATILMGLSLLLLGNSHRLLQELGMVFSFAVAAIGGATLSEHVFGWNLGIDQLLFREAPGAPATVSPGRMGPPAATCFLLGGIALVLYYRRRATRLAQVFASIVALWGLLSVIGYAYGATQLFGVAALTAIAFPTALTLFVVGLGLLAARPTEGLVAPLSSELPGGVMARRLLPTAILVPVALGAICLYGERANWYDLGLGTSVFVAAIIVVFTGVVWQSARALNQTARQRNEAQAALLREREDLADFVENAALGLHWVGADGTILWANQEELTMLGYGREEYVGRNIVDFHVDRPVITDILERLKAGETLRHYEARLRCKDGTIRQVQISSNVRWEDGKFVHTRCFTRDVTERRMAQDAVLEAQRQLSMALSAARMGTWSWNVATGSLEWSDNLAEIHGLAPGTFGGTYEAFLACVHPEDRDRVDAGVRRAVQEKSTYDVEFRVPFPDGTMHWVAGHGQVFVDAAGNPVRMIGIGQDITARREGEEALACAYAQAQDALKVRDTFLSVAGHEFRTPLGALSLTLHNLERRLTKDLDEATRKEIRSLQRQVDRLVRLTEDLLEVGRINAGRLVLEVAPVELGQLAADIVERFREPAEAAGSKIALDAPVPVLGTWDGSRLDQVFSNLIANAVKFGSGRPVEVSVSRRGDLAVFAVRDRGIGIAAEDQARIFERFGRGASAKSYRGLGLGLWISSQIVESHGGRINVQSELGEGSTFRVELPMEGRVS